jgi:hypothetical protein
MILLDRLLVGGIKFVLQRIADAAEAELNDEGALREQLLAAQMRLELGEITDEEFVQIEAALLARIRVVQAARGVGVAPDGGRVAGVEVSVGGDEAE